MCYDGKCMHCINIETGSLIFGVISVITTGLGILFAVGVLIYLNVFVAVAAHDQGISGEELRLAYFVAVLPASIAIGIILCTIIISFSFNVVLIKGLVQKKPGLVKVYFVYCVVVKGLALFGGVMGIITGRYSPEFSLIIFAGTIFYVLILRMIYLTYKKLEMDAQFKPNLLVENKY